MVAILTILRRKDLLISYQYDIKSGHITCVLYNSSNQTMVIPAKTYVIALKKAPESRFVVELLDGKKRTLTNGQAITCGAQDPIVSSLESVDLMSELTPLVDKYKVVFQDEVVPVPDIMSHYAMSRQDLIVEGDLRGSGGHSYNVETLVPPQVIQSALKELMDAGYVEEVPREEWCFLHPLIFLPKSQNKCRIVCDLRELNGYFAHRAKNLPSLMHVLHSIPDSWRLYIRLDIRNGFFRIPLNSNIRNYFAFGIGGRRLRFCVVPQGFKGSSSHFHSVLARILEGCRKVQFMDDILVGGGDIDELKNNLEEVLIRLQIHGLQVQKSKIECGISDVSFLGFNVSSGGVVSAKGYLESRLKKIKINVQRKRDLQQVLGVFNVVRHFVPSLATILLDLQRECNKLTYKCCPESQSMALNEQVNKAWKAIVKSCLDVQMGIHQERSSYELYTDWSGGAQGYLLLRRCSDNSRTCVDINSSNCDTVTSSYLGELRCIIWALKLVKSYVYGDLTVFCDNQSTVTRLQSLQDDGQDLRVSQSLAWILSNMPDVTFRFYPSSLNVIADYLSRNFAFEDKESKEVTAFVVEPCHMIIRHANDSFSDEEKEAAIISAHQGHWGVNATIQHLAMTCGVWKGVRAQVKRFIERCPVCQWHQGREVRDIYSGYKAEAFNDVVHLDFCGPLPNKLHFLVMVDGASRYISTTLAKGPRARVVLSSLKAWAQHSGMMKRVVSDNARCFTSVLIQSWCRRNSVMHSFSPPGCPSANGMAERAVGRVLHILRRSGCGEEWADHLDWATHELNRGYCRSIGTCPKVLVERVGRDGNPIDLRTWQYAWERARRLSQKAQDYENERLKKKFPFCDSLQVGQEVLVFNPLWKQGRAGKLSSMWQGPFYVTQRLSQSVWEVQGKDNSPYASHCFPVHSSQVRSFWEQHGEI